MFTFARSRSLALGAAWAAPRLATVSVGGGARWRAGGCRPPPALKGPQCGGAAAAARAGARAAARAAAERSCAGGGRWLSEFRAG